MLRSVPLALLLAAGCASATWAEPPNWIFDQPFMPQRGRIGVQVQPMTAELREHFKAPPDSGLLVTHVDPERPAARGGVHVGDVIVMANGEPIRQPFDLVKAVGRVPAGQTLELRIVRDKEERTLTVKPEGEAAPWVDPEGWKEWMEQGMRRGSEQLRHRLEELERRLEELERKLEERGRHEDGNRT
jgi:hypothetical protein